MVDFTTRHVKWCVSSLSAAGPIIRRSVQAKHYGAVLIYKRKRNKERNKYFFQVYLASNNASEIKVMKQNDCNILSWGPICLSVSVICIMKITNIFYINTSRSLFLPLSISDHLFLHILFLCVQAIEETVRSSKQEWIKINKPPTCMLEEKYYHLTSVPERKIEPSVCI